MRRIISNKEIVLGVTGSIAAYKACELASRLAEYGARVTPMLTDAARELIGAATFEALTGRRAVTALFGVRRDPEITHIALAARADLFLIAPATAHNIAKAAHGIADDMLSTTLLATRGPILFAPAMNENMYAHPATQANIETLRQRGCHFAGPAVGRLACGTAGPGRMIDPARILEAAVPLLCDRKELAGKQVLITSGANHEPIDPVRFIGNRSSGKMGRAVALEALARGARVTVITGPCEAPLPYGAEAIRVETAREMAEAALDRAEKADVVIAAAAVADYRVENAASEKIKRDGSPVPLTLVENPDILAEIGARKRPGQIVAGFAAETRGLVHNAEAKLKQKNLDLVVAAHVGTADSGFGTDTLKTVFLAPGGSAEDYPLSSKEEIAEKLMDHIAALLASR